MAGKPRHFTPHKEIIERDNKALRAEARRKKPAVTGKGKRLELEKRIDA